MDKISCIGPLVKYQFICDELYIVSFRQACMNRITKNDTIGYSTTQRRIADGVEKIPHPTTQSQRSQRTI
jgi:hypothetical protein